MGSLLSGMDLCFNPAAPGPPDAEGHYALNFGLIQRANDNDPWTKVSGFTELVNKNTDFVITLYDMSGTLSQVDFVTVAWRPDSGDSGPSSDDSPFSPSDFDAMLRGKVLQRAGNWGSVGCGQGGSGNAFTFGTYTFKNSGAYEVTIEARVTYQGQTLEFKCDPKIIVGT